MNDRSKLSIIAVALALSCKPVKSGDDARLKSLDNLARADGSAEVMHLCGVAYTGGEAIPAALGKVVGRIDAPSDATRNAAIGALVAVPPLLMQPFVEAGGRIRIVTDAASQCAGTPLSEAERSVMPAGSATRACWRQLPGRAPELVLDADPDLVRHSLVRLFAYAYAELFVARILDPSAPAPFDAPEWKRAARAFEAMRTDLATRLLRDVRSSQSRGRLEAFAAADPAGFRSVVFAESVDSYYCNATSRARFAADFAATWEGFTASGPHSPVGLFGGR